MKNLIYALVVLALLAGGVLWLMGGQSADTDDATMPDDATTQDVSSTMPANDAGTTTEMTVEVDASAAADTGIGEGY